MSVLSSDPASEYLRRQLNQAEQDLEDLAKDIEALDLRRRAAEQGRGNLQDAILSFQAALSHLADMGASA